MRFIKLAATFTLLTTMSMHASSNDALARRPLPAKIEDAGAVLKPTSKASPPAEDVRKAASTAEDAKKSASKISRLSKDVLPTHYDLAFEPDLKKFSFAGSAKIELSVVKPVHEIVLNAADLNFSSAQLVSADGSKKMTPTVAVDKTGERATFLFGDEVAPGNYSLSCEFAGELNDKLHGFYRSSFEDDKHTKHWLATTQMEPSDARRMFPCFDEPEFKATYKLTTTVDPIYAAISNAPVEKEEQKNGKKIVYFEKSPKMSSYLVALVIGELKPSAEKVVDGVPLRVWAVDGKEKLTNYALEQGAKILEYERNYFGVKYPNKKLDLIAIPDFAPGAMENLGAITFRDHTLLTDDDTASIFHKEGVVSIIAHEVAHQWFGDLVTMRWWDDLWLNEAFATWMATKTSDALHPEWRVMAKANTSQSGMGIDTLRTTRAIHADVTNPGQVWEMFDGITYGKGASVLRMLETFVGDKKFEDGVTKYLTDHAWSNATAEDLWNSIAAAAPGVPVAQIMSTFVMQPGVPLVYVNESADGKSLNLRQVRFFALEEDKVDKSLWMVPVTARNLKDQNGEGNSLSKVLSKTEDSDSLAKVWDAPVLNPSGTGYFRTCYAGPILKRLQENYDKLNTTEKVLVNADASALVLSGRTTIADAYNFALYLPKETDPLVQSPLLSTFFGPDHYVTADERPQYEKLIRHYATPLKNKLGWNEIPNESENEKSLRTLVLNLMGSCGQDQATIKEANELVDKYQKDRASVSGNIIGTALSITAYNGGEKEYEQIVDIYRTSKNPEDRNRALFTLSMFKKPEIAKKVLDFAMTDEVRVGDGLHLISAVASRRETRAIGWPYIESHWDQIVHRFPEDHLRTLASAAGTVDTREQEAEVKKWFESHPLPKSETAIKRMIEAMDLLLIKRERFGKSIREWTIAQASKLPN